MFPFDTARDLYTESWVLFRRAHGPDYFPLSRAQNRRSFSTSAPVWPRPLSDERALYFSTLRACYRYVRGDERIHWPLSRRRFSIAPVAIGRQCERLAWAVQLPRSLRQINAAYRVSRYAAPSFSAAFLFGTRLAPVNRAVKNNARIFPVTTTLIGLLFQILRARIARKSASKYKRSAEIQYLET